MDPAKNLLKRIKLKDKELEEQTHLMPGSSFSDIPEIVYIIDEFNSTEIKAFKNFSREEISNLFLKFDEDIVLLK